MATQTERRAATVGEIDRAARRLFQTRGFAETTIDNIVAQAGVAKGAFYHHYRSKEAIFEKIFDQTQAALAGEVATVAVKGGNPVAMLRLGLYAYIEACERPSVRQILLVDGPAVIGWVRWRDIDAKYFGDMTRRTVAAALGPQSPAVHVQAITALISGAFTEAAMASAANSKSRLSSQDLVAGMDVLLKGLESPPSTALRANRRKARKS
jgi:AcrR family transcriptional regulator